MTCHDAINLISARLNRQIDPDQLAQLEQHLHECPACRTTVARVQAQLTAPPAPRRSWRPSVLGAGLTAATLLAATLIALFFLWRREQPAKPHPDIAQETLINGRERLLPRARPAAPALAMLQAGEQVQTKAGERRRLALPDGSVLYVNQNTVLHLIGHRQARLERGTVFVEVAPRKDGGAEATFRVATPKREVTALGTKFEVQADDSGTGVLVTQGQVQVSGLPKPLQAGEQLPAGSDKPTGAPRASHVLSWMRDLMAAAESPLVPANRRGLTKGMRTTPDP